MKLIVGGVNTDYMTLKEASEKWGVSSQQIIITALMDASPVLSKWPVSG